MNLEWKAFGVIWHAWFELGITTDVIFFGKLIHLHMLNRILILQYSFGGGGYFDLS